MPLFAMLPFMVMAQSNTDLFPYNPDVDGDGEIGTGDLLGFLPNYGSSFVVDGLLPVESGGTGVGTIEEARQVLSVSVFEDLLDASDSAIGGVISGDMMITGLTDINGDLSTGGSIVAGTTLQSGLNSNAGGSYSVATGINCNASGPYSRATNRNTTAQGICSTAEGEGSSSLSTAAHAEGFNTIASGVGSHSEGSGTSTDANYAHAEGYQSTATGIASHAEGWSGDAAGNYAHSEGRETSANGDTSHAEGFQTMADGYGSHAEGYQTAANGSYSHSGGRGSIASGSASTAMGYNVTADQDYSTVVGQYNVLGQTGSLFVVGAGSGDADRVNALEVSATGTKIEGELFINGEAVMQIIGGLQQQIAQLQAQVEALSGGE